MANRYQRNRILRIIIKTINYLRSKYLYFNRRIHARAVRIILDPQAVFEVVYKIKDETWEDTCYPECYGHNKEMHLTVYSPAEYIYKGRNAIVNASSDTIITSQGVFWSKFNNEEFVTWAKPADENVVWYNRETVGIIKMKKKQRVKGRVLSLIGLWSYHWAHNLFEFLPQLFTAGEAGLLNQDISILVDENVDSNILELINKYLESFENAKVVFVSKGVDYECEELFFMPIPGPCYCDYKFRLDYVEYIPRFVLDMIKHYVVKPLIEKVKDNEPKYEKVFLPRNKAFTHTGRYLKNYDEVHDYFLSQGFVDIEGSTMTLEEKADVFYHAKEIVGMFGSSLFNLIFCNQAKVISLSNYKFVTETVELVMAKDYISRMVTITGQDDNSEYGSDFYIPLEKIEKAYKEIMIENC